MRRPRPNVKHMLSYLNEQFSYMAVIRDVVNSREDRIKNNIIYTALMLAVLQFNVDDIVDQSINYFVWLFINELQEDFLGYKEELDENERRLEYIEEYERLLQKEWSELQMLIEDNFSPIEYDRSEERAEKRRENMEELLTIIEGFGFD